jgi:hypothetical protein
VGERFLDAEEAVGSIPSAPTTNKGVSFQTDIYGPYLYGFPGRI